jgi:hypothetical protein
LHYHIYHSILYASAKLLQLYDENTKK